MPQIKLTQGAYEARSLIANAQRCVNLYPERNTDDAEVPFTHYQTPGLTKLCSTTPEEVRALYTTSTGQLYAIVGNSVWYIPNSFVPQKLGTINTSHGYVSMYDDKTTLYILDGTYYGWQVTLATNALALFSPANFNGGNQIRYLDTFLLSSVLGGNLQASGSGTTVYDGLALATMSGDADFLQIFDVVHREAWLFGKRTTEIWVNTGGFPFPLSPIPGAFVQHGIAALRSLAKWGLNIFWLSQDNNGQALVMLGSAYKATIISTPALIDEISQYIRIDDAIGFCYQQGTHIFYFLTFPTANKTWCYDISTQLWHERGWFDSNGAMNRHRANCVAFAYNKTIVGDWQNGYIYAFDLTNYTDNGAPITRIRSFPHLLQDGKRVAYKQFSADVEVGRITDPSANPQISLRWSDDRGISFGSPMMQGVGRTGQFRTIPSWSRLGMARDRVFELFWSEPCPMALNGAWVEAEAMET